ncbi:MAG: ABC transporter ATP-binding protein [Phycisphaerae bacterium]
MLDRIKTLWELMRGYRLRYLMAIGALVVATFMGYLPPLIGGRTIDYVIGDKPLQAPQFLKEIVAQFGGRSELAQNLWAAGLAMFSFFLLAGFFTYLKGHWSATASESIAKRLRNRLYGHLQNVSVGYHDTTDTGDLVQRCSSDVETIRMFLAMQVTEVGRALITLVVGIPIMLYVNVPMTVAALALMGPIVIYSILFFLKVKNVFQQCDESEGRMTARLQENLTGIRVVRAFARQEHETARFARTNEEYRGHWYRLVRVLSWFWSVSDFMCLTQIGVVLVFGAYQVQHGRLSVGELFAFLGFVHRFLWPVRYMGRVLADFGKAIVSLGRVKEVLDQPEEDAEDEITQPAGPTRTEGRIDVRFLSFSHDGEHNVLDNISFTVEPGQTLAILGPSGSGKTTLVSLILRLYDYQTGEICIDGTELRDMPRKTVRSQFGVVMQEPFLYSRTIGENIRLGGSAADDEQIQQAARAACIHDSIERFDHGYQTLVGERGVTLSGGQRQRVAIARALLGDPPILVLDDALSAVDTRTEQMILDALKKRRGRKTTIVIAHRLTTLQRADRILVLDHGKIVQAGTHRSLLDQPGPYRRLWTIQNQLEDDFEKDQAATASAQPGKNHG